MHRPTRALVSSNSQKQLGSTPRLFATQRFVSLSPSKLHSTILLRNVNQKKSVSLRELAPSSRSFFRKFSTTVEAEEVKKEELGDAPVEISEKSVGASSKLEFQAETRKLLDIVARSLYTEREVFIRELISNASDALEKVRHIQLLGQEVESKDAPLEINITTDPKNRRLIIQDSGIGMSKEEMIENLGSIGHSGSLEFIKNLKDKNVTSNDIIGQFGVGFYSSFMVSESVTVYSKSARPGSKGYCWISDGTGSYEISEAEGVSVGTKIILNLNSKSEEFASKESVERIIKNYSNFVGFPIKLNNKLVNTVKALWTMNKKDISENDHKEFYQFVAHAHDEPLFHLHFTTDSPLNIRALVYVGNQHSEKFGMGRMEPGVNLFSKKVLIQPRAKGLLPDYLRFIKGVVDSEDIPLNLSREHLQDSALIRRISNVLTKRILKWLDEEAKKNPEKYTEFWDEFGAFIREGICTDFGFKEDIAKLLRSESSALPSGKLTSLEDYVSRISEDQKEIFFLCVPNRQLAESSPYYEAFKAKNKEVLFMYTQLDDFVMTNLAEYSGRKLVSIESSAAKQALKADKAEEDKGEKLSSEDVKELSKWMKEVLSGKVSSISESDRLFDSPAIIVDHESASIRRMMKYVDPSRSPELPKQQLEINPKHQVIRGLNTLRTSNEGLAKLVAEQLFDNALVAAGLLDDPRYMVPRMTSILDSAIQANIRKST